MSALLGVPVDAAYHVVFALAGVLTPVLGGFAAAAGIILFTLAIRLAVAPLTFRALRGQIAQARLAPHVQRLRERYGKQSDRLGRELTALYAREGTSAFAGLGPLLAQWPVFSVVYLLFRSPVIAGAPNRLLSHDLFGVPLGAHWLSGPGLLSEQGAVFLGLLAVLVGACWLATRVARRMSAALAPVSPSPVSPPRPASSVSPSFPASSVSPSSLTSSVSPSSPVSTAFPATAAPGIPNWLGQALPYLTVIIAAFAPLAAVIYLITSTTWSAAERHIFGARTRARATAR